MSGAEMVLIWTEYMKYRVKLRGFNLAEIEHIVRYSVERYFDTSTGRHVVVGNTSGKCVIIPYDDQGDTLTPVTIHAITRQQINFRLKTERFTHE